MEEDKPFNVLDDNYSVFVPIEDTDIMKSVEVDENGDYIVNGVMTTDAKDEEDDSISPEGMDCSYFLEKGWIKYEHGNKPEQFIGEPMEVKVGQFTHPTTNKSVTGIFVKGRLFAHRNLAKQAVQTITDLKKSHTKRRMGWSIEGNVKERDRKSGKIIKSVLRNVVLTMNPVNTTTWAELSKSFAKNHELTIATDEPLDKAMDIASAEPIIPQSLEGAKPKKKDPQQAWIESYRALVKKLLNKSFRKRFIASPNEAEAMAYMTGALEFGLDDEGANAFASYIAEKHAILKSLGMKIGGANMADETKQAIASLLDESLEELEKSLQADFEDDFEDDEEDDLNKSMNEDDDDEDDNKDDSKDDENDDDDEDDKKDDKKDDLKKSIKSGFAKSLAEDEGTAKAFEVSDFLVGLSDEVGFHFDGFEKSLMATRKQNDAISKSLLSVAELVKSLSQEVTGLKDENEDLKKSLDEVLNRPVGRRSVVNNREVQTLTKSIDGAGGGTPSGKPRTRGEVVDILLKSMDAGEIGGSEIARFEGGVPLDKLGLPQSVISKLI